MEKRGSRQLNYDEAISPIDGRYYEEVKEASKYFSESALVKARVKVESEYIKLLMDAGIAPSMSLPDFEVSFERVKQIERRVRHDVKAVEIYLREELARIGMKDLRPYVHIALTSEDVNSIANGILLKKFMDEVLIPSYRNLALELASLARTEAGTLMPARTHGKIAVPTTFGKEISVFAVRIAERVGKLSSTRPIAKFSGAAGTYASFRLIKKTDWLHVLDRFVRSFELDFATYTTQIAPYERLSDILHYVININQIMLSLSRDLWTYQMLGYLTIRSAGSAVGSSTMPQKENPSDLENAEAQCEISNSLLMLLSYRLEVNRLQRDLTDSSIRRISGQALAHSLLACKRISDSLKRVEVLRNEMNKEVKKHWEMMAESAQISLRLRRDADGYDRVFGAFRKGKRSDAERIVKRYAVRAEDYLGYSVALAESCGNEVSKLIYGF